MIWNTANNVIWNGAPVNSVWYNQTKVWPTSAPPTYVDWFASGQNYSIYNGYATAGFSPVMPVTYFSSDLESATMLETATFYPARWRGTKITSSFTGYKIRPDVTSFNAFCKTEMYMSVALTGSQNGYGMANVSAVFRTGPFYKVSALSREIGPASASIDTTMLSAFAHRTSTYMSKHVQLGNTMYLTESALSATFKENDYIVGDSGTETGTYPYMLISACHSYPQGYSLGCTRYWSASGRVLA